jgi:hypothetical protein
MKQRRTMLVLVLLLIAVPILVLVTDWIMVQRFEAAARTLQPGDPQSLATEKLGPTDWGAGVATGRRRIHANWYYAGPIAKARLYLAEVAAKRDWSTLHRNLQPPIRVAVELEHGKIRKVVFGPTDEYYPSTAD